MAQFKLRLPESLRVALDQATARSGQSLNSEIVHRLEQSFAAEEELGGPELAGLLKSLAIIMRTAGGSAKRLADGTNDPADWLDHPYGYDQAVKAALHVFEALRPPGAVALPESAGPPVDRLLETLGGQFAAAMLGQVRSQSPQVVEGLGRLAHRLHKQEEDK